jgi:hypothetical protein
MIEFLINIEKLILFIQEKVDQEQKCILFLSWLGEIIFPGESGSKITFVNSRYDSKNISV